MVLSFFSRFLFFFFFVFLFSADIRLIKAGLDLPLPFLVASYSRSWSFGRFSNEKEQKELEENKYIGVSEIVSFCNKLNKF